MYVCEPCVYSDHRGQKMGWDPLDLELQVVVSEHVSAGYKTQVLSRSALHC